MDVIELIKNWLSCQQCYVNVKGTCSNVYNCFSGTVQGSILGPFLYAVYVSPLFDLQKLTNFADDNFIVRWNRQIEVLIDDMEKSLEMITKWFRDSGLKVNESKTEICLFHRMDYPPIVIKIGDSTIKTSKSMNVLGVIFDSKLQWSLQVANSINKSKSALHAIKLIKGFFTPNELLTLITSNFYSVLYYNSEIWHLPGLGHQLKAKLLTASSNALKICTPSYDLNMSYKHLHSFNKRALPSQILMYKHALLLFNIYTLHIPHFEWIALNFDQTISSRQNKFETRSNTTYHIGKNILSARLSILNNKIPLDWLNLGKDSYKVKCKGLFF
jgi:hypothetical protein